MNAFVMDFHSDCVSHNPHSIPPCWPPVVINVTGKEIWAGGGNIPIFHKHYYSKYFKHLKYPKMFASSVSRCFGDFSHKVSFGHHRMIDPPPTPQK